MGRLHVLKIKINTTRVLAIRTIAGVVPKYKILLFQQLEDYFGEKASTENRQNVQPLLTGQQWPTRLGNQYTTLRTKRVAWAPSLR